MKNIKSLIALFFILATSIIFSQEQIPYSVFSSMGGLQSNSNNMVYSTLGESVIGVASNSSNQLLSGFWNVYKQNVVTAVEDDEIVPLEFRMEQNYPNPFNPSTIIRFSVSEKSNVVLKVYDILGSEVATLVNNDMDIGRYEVEFRADNYSSGIYIYKISAGDFVSTKKMILLK
jgi:hypothetical protein